MGLDAYVNCRCYQDGKIEAPEAVKAHIEVTFEGISLGLPYEGNEKLHEVFDDWYYTACPHESMEVCSERISNWGGYRKFQEALHNIGWQNFPTLKQYLPQNNGGQLPVEDAPAALQELKKFLTFETVGQEYLLINRENSQTINSYIASYDGVFMHLGSNGTEYGLHPETGFFVRRADDKSMLFSSSEFVQKASGEGAEFFCLSTSQSLVAGALLGEYHKPQPRYLKVVQKTNRPADFIYVVEPLRKVLEAAIRVGNPVCWC